MATEHASAGTEDVGCSTAADARSFEHRTQRILVVEDEPDIARVLEFALSSAGFQVSMVNDARAALDAAVVTAPDLMLLDVMIPGMSGFDVLRTLRSDAPTAAMAIILVTARTRLDDRLVGWAAGADDYITKPFEIEELLCRVKTVLRRTRQLRGLSPLTGLPGNFDIARLLDELVAGQHKFALIHADLDSFKAYNDKHGFLRGDQAIRSTADLLSATLSAVSQRPRFVGHIGGDDFAVITSEDEAERYASSVVARFHHLVSDLHEPAELASHAMCVVGRDGVMRYPPLLSISLGIATTAVRSFQSSTQAAAIACEMKVVAKATAGSSWAADRRRA